MRRHCCEQGIQGELNSYLLGLRLMYDEQQITPPPYEKEKAS